MSRRMTTFSKLLLTLIILVLMFFAGYGILKQIENPKKEYLGKQVVVDGDTLTVLNYSLELNSFVLSNGGMIHPDIIEDYVLKEESKFE